MPENRFYINSPLEVGAHLSLDPIESHHIIVMRKKKGDLVELVNGHNVLGKGSLLSLHNKKVELLVEEVVIGKKKKREFTLCQALCDLSRLDLILQKSTELGVHEIYLFAAERSTKQEINAHQKKRMEALLISAMKQCGRLDLPPLDIKSSLHDFLPTEIATFYGDVAAEAPLFHSCLKEIEKLLFFVGPPSGFTENEENILKNLGALGVKLNDFILRTETAAIAALSLGMH